MKVRGDAVSVVMKATPVIGPQSVVPLFPPGGAASGAVVCTNRTDVGGGLAQYVCAAKVTRRPTNHGSPPSKRHQTTSQDCVHGNTNQSVR